MSPASSSRRPARPAAPTARKPGSSGASPAPAKRRFPIALVAGALLAVGLVTVIVLTMGSASAPAEVGTPTITGDPLPDFAEFANDPAVGLLIPEVTGADFGGTEVSILRDGRVKVLMFFAHWCDVCRREVPSITNWLTGATLPEGVDLISVSSGVRSNRVNYPPSKWFASEGWPVPLIMDDAADSVGRAYGLTAYPYFIFVDADGRVVLRLVGAVPVATIASIITELTGA